MVYTGIKGYFKKLMIYLKSWRILLPILMTLYMIMVDQSTNYFTNYYIAFMLWSLFYSQSASKKSKEWRMLSLLPSDTRLRAIHWVSEMIGTAVMLIVWRSSIYVMELLLNLCTLERAVNKFFGLDLIIILLISIMWRISAYKVNIGKGINKVVDNTVFIISGILLCVHIILFIMNIELGWLGISFTVLAYLGIAAVWYVVLLGIRDSNFDYETMTVKPVKQ